MADVQWLTRKSAELAHEAGRARLSDPEIAPAIYRDAARLAVEALRLVDPSKAKTRSILGYSAATLLFKSGQFREAGDLATSLLPSVSDGHAREQLQVVLSSVWAEEAKLRSGAHFLPGQVVVSISGGKVLTGGAPLDLVLRQVKNVQNAFVRVIEYLSDLPFQGRSGRARVLDEMCRPWIFQMPAGSYQFAIAVEEVRQLDFFRGGVSPQNVTDKFLEVLSASTSPDPTELDRLVEDKQYRRSFVQLARRLVPSDHSFEQIRIYSPTASKEVKINYDAYQITTERVASLLPASDPHGPQECIGTLRALDLDKDWLIVDTADGPVRVSALGDAVDDYIGELVNRKVKVQFFSVGRSRRFLDIAPF